MKLGHLQRCPLLVALTWGFLVISVRGLSIRREPVTEQVLIITTPPSSEVVLQDEVDGGTTPAAAPEKEQQSDDATTVDSVVLQDTTGESWEVDPTVNSIVSKDVEIEFAGKEPKKPVVKLSEHASEKPVLPEIYSFRIQSDVQYRYSRTYVTSRVANKDATRAQEVTFSVVLPETAFISKFVMEIDGKPYEAYVKEKEEAKKDYVQAQSQGQTAGLVEKSTRNSNVFNVNVNVKPQTKVTFNLTYEELLSRRLGRYEQAININPDQVSSIKDYQIVVNIEESRNLTFVRVPSLSNDIEDQTDPTGNNKDAVIERPAPNKAKITWSPSTADQKKLVKEGISGKFLVQYDVEREADAGQILVMQGYFVHFFAPENLPPLRKHVVFILDISGSMWGRKMEQLKESQKKILDDLSSDDFFNIITFSSDVYLWSPSDKVDTKRNEFRTFSSGLELTPPEIAAKKQPIAASPENIKKAKTFIDSLVANGGTNIHDAIIEALNLTEAIKNAQRENSGGPATEGIEVVDTTLPAASPSTTTAAATTTTTTTTTSAAPTTQAAQTTTTTTTTSPSSTTEEEEENTSIVIVDIAKSDMELVTEQPEQVVSQPGKAVLPPNVQSLIIFLTDGEPTVGVTDPPEIQRLIQTANRNLSIPIFSLGFGEGADFPFLKKLSLQNYGFGRKIYEASDASLQLQGFYSEIASPLLANVTFNYTSPEFNVTDVTVTRFPTIFGGTEIAVAGKLVAPPKPERFDEETTISPSNDATVIPTTVASDYEEELNNDDAPVGPPVRLTISCDFRPSDRTLFDVSVEGSGRDGEIDLKNVEVLERPRQCIDFPFVHIPDRLFPPRPTPPPTPEDQFLERLWAYLTIQQLIEKDLAQGESKDETSTTTPPSIAPTPVDQDTSETPTLTLVLPDSESTTQASSSPVVISNSTKPETLKEKALRLALKYGFVTPLTSLVVVKPNSSDVTNAVAADGRPDVADSFFARRLSFASPILMTSPNSGPIQRRSGGGGGGKSRRVKIQAGSGSSYSGSRYADYGSAVPTNMAKPFSIQSLPASAPQSMPVLALAAPQAYVKTASAGFLHNRIAAHPIQANYALSHTNLPVPFTLGGGAPAPPPQISGGFPAPGFYPPAPGPYPQAPAAVPDDSYETDLESENSVSTSVAPHPSTTPSFPSTTTTPPQPTTTQSSSSLSLSDITWLSETVSVLRVNETDYKIARNETIGVASYDCTTGTDGAAGQCSLLQDCVLAAFVNSEETFRTSYFCPLKSSSFSSDNYVGTCCPSSRLRVSPANGQIM